MNERILEITDMNVHLSSERGFIVVTVKDGKNYKIPTDEIGGVIANSYGLTYTNSVLVKLAENNIPLVICGNNHMPAGILWSTDPHHKTAGRIDFQLQAKTPLYKRIWQSIVRTKIANQAMTLKALNKNHILVESLIPKVSSGDSSNIEGLAARTYWKELFGKNFIRDQDGGGINSMLNYGYAIIRSGMARSVMGAGLHPAIGIFHKNKSNPMRLVDDLMEPFRPIVDFKVYGLSAKLCYELTPDIKKSLVETLYLDMDSPRGRSPVINRMQTLATTFAISLERQKIVTDLPILNVQDLMENVGE